MDLPLVEEIREARRLADEAQAADLHQKQIHNVLTALAVVQRQIAGMRGDIEVAMPGDDLIEALAERWPQLADLPTLGPRPTQPVAERIRMRRTQLEGAAQLLAPLAREAEAHAHRLAHLQHEQQHRLEDPRYAEAVADLQRTGVERERARLRLEPLKMKLNGIDPAFKVISSFVTHLDRELKSEMTVPGAAAWRAGMVARNLAIAVDSLLAELHFEVPHPVPPHIPDAPSLEHSDALRAEAQRVRDELGVLLDALQGEHAALMAQMASLQERYDALTSHIVDRLG